MAALNREEPIELVEGDVLLEATEKLIAQGMIDAADVGTLQTARIRSFIGLMEHISLHPAGVNGLTGAKLDKICEASQIILDKKAANKWKTNNIIERKALLQHYLGLKKKIASLTASIELNVTGGGTSSNGQIAHWERELISCKTRAANMELNNNF